MNYDFEGYEPLIGFRDGLVFYTTADSGIETAADLAAHDDTVYYGGLGLSAGEARIAYGIEQIAGEDNFEALFGYDGSGDVMAAVMRGELTVGAATTASYINNVEPLVEEGTLVPLMVQGYVDGDETHRDDLFPDLPTIPEVYEEAHGEAAEGPGWDFYRILTSAAGNLSRVLWAHEDAPEESLEALRAGVEQVTEDQEHIEEVTSIMGAYQSVTGEDLVQIYEDINAATSDEAISFGSDYIQSHAD